MESALYGIYAALVVFVSEILLVRFLIRQQLVSMNYSLFTRPSCQEEKGIVLALVFPSSSNCPLLFKAHTYTGGISCDRFPAISLA